MTAQGVLTRRRLQSEIVGGLHVLMLVVLHGDKAPGDTERLAGQPDKFLQHIVAAFVGTAQCLQRLVPVQNKKVKMYSYGPARIEMTATGQND